MIPDGPLAFFTTLVVWAAWRICQDGRTRDYLLAGVTLGLAVGLKYNAAVFALAIVLAHFLRTGWRGVKDWRLYVAGAISLVVFAATTPFAILDSQDLPARRVHRHPSLHRRPRREYWKLTGMVPDVLLADEGPVLLLAAAGALWGVCTAAARGAILVATTALAYLLFISAFAVHAERIALPLIPLFAILAAYCLVSLLPSQTPDRTGVQLGAAAALIVVALIFPLTGAVSNTVRLTTPDGLDTAREWIEP